MAFRKKVFTSQRIVLRVDGKDFRVQALVSVYGAKYVYEEDDLPSALRDRIGSEIEVIYKNIPTKARFVREVLPIGTTVYSLRFLSTSTVLRKQIERDLKDSGIPSPWLRSLPRLSTNVDNLPVPSLAIVYYKGQNFFLNVNNFTLGGLQIEYTGIDLRSVSLGDHLEFDLVTNQGDKISDLIAVVTHIASEINIGDTGLDRYTFGIRFQPMSLLSSSKYKELIKEYCLALKMDIHAPVSEV